MTQIDIQEGIAIRVEAILRGPPKSMQSARIALARKAGRLMIMAKGYTEDEARALVEDAVQMAELRARAL